MKSAYLSPPLVFGHSVTLLVALYCWFLAKNLIHVTNLVVPLVYFVVSIPSLVHKMLLTPISSISINFNFPRMVFMSIVSCSVLSRVSS